MVGTAALAVLQTQAWAQSTDSSRYPDKAVRIIITSPPGGGQDRVARILQGPLQKLLGQPVVVESIAGAQGIIGTQNIIRSQPDGYRLMFMNTKQQFTSGVVMDKAPYDLSKDITPIIPFGYFRTAVIVHPTIPGKDLLEVLQYAKANPNKVYYATVGTGTSAHLAMSMAARKVGAEMLAVPYKGAGPSFLAVISGEVNLAYSSLAIAKPAAEAGKVKLIAVTGNRRAAAFPSTASLGESNSDPNLGTFWGLYAPAKTPAAVVARLNTELNKALASAAFQSFAQQGFLETMAGTPEQFAATLAQAQVTSARTFQTIGIQLTDAPSDAPQASPRP
jgi:tripartite-type tricarboxylate transporter receptor subunit TctC